MIECSDFDKYGRLLIDITDNLNKKISEWLIENKYAFPYDGGKKKNWNDHLDIINNIL
jgi:endonuclease YncB( thermonuclease family)